MRVTVTDYNHITGSILNAAIEVHRRMGPGLLESAYRPCLEYELRLRNLRYEAQRAFPIMYKDLALDASYRADIIVEEVIVVELKSVETILPIHELQLLTYLRVTHCPVGLLINFHVPRLMDGVSRKVNPQASTDAGRPGCP